MSTFPAAPNDPFAAKFGTGMPTSPFRVGDGVDPPLLVGRNDHLAEAAEMVQLLTEHRQTPILSLHGPSGIGKTSLLQRIETEVTELGGVVARIDGRDDTSGYVGLADVHDRLRAGVPHPVEPVEDTIDGRYRAAAAVAAETKRPFVVMVDNLHVASELTDTLGSNHGIGGGLIFAGAHDHGRLSSMPTGIRSLEVGYLQPHDAKEAIAAPLAANGVDVDPDLLAACAARSGGLPLAVQAWGTQLWHSAHDGRGATADELQPHVDAQLGRHYSTIWMSLTDTERQYVDVLATPFGGAMSAGRVAELAGYAASQNASPLRGRLLDQGIVTVPERGHLEVAIAGLGRWRASQRAGLACPDSSAPRVAATRKQYGLAAERPVTYQPGQSRNR